jgi:hypothetical protein
VVTKDIDASLIAFCHGYVNVVISPTAGCRRVLSRPVGVKSQSGRKAVILRHIRLPGRDPTARSIFWVSEISRPTGANEHH